MRGPNPATVWATAFMDELARAGVREVCVAPGSRSTPLVLAAATDGRFRVHSILDERSAGFFALGVGKRSGAPAAVITTSGTAGANLYPAVVEASQGEVPLLLLTADRPHRLRDTDGNQAMDQLRLFGAFPRGFFEVAPPRMGGPELRHLRAQAGRAVALAMGPPRGPVHLNFPFQKPLEPPPEEDVREAWDAFAAEHSRAVNGRAGGKGFVSVPAPTVVAGDEEVEALATLLAGTGRGLIVAGPVPNADEVGPALLALGAATGFPVLADPLSGARFSPGFGARVVAGYDLFLRSERARELLAPEVILRVGASPTSAAALGFLAQAGEAHQVVIDDGHRWKDHLAVAHRYLRASPAPLLRKLAARAARVADPHWSALWEEAEAGTRAILEGLPPGELLEGEILAAVVTALPEEASLLVASSMPIRDLDAFAPTCPETLRVFGNRGVSGIDGLVSTTVGIAVAAEGVGTASPTVGVLGDLAFLHDLNGLMALRSLGPRVVLVVINNDGGGIFHTLPVKEEEPHFTRLFATPHGLELRRAADLFELHYQEADSLASFRETIIRALDVGGPSILEVRTRREETHARRRVVVEEVVRAMEGLGSAGSEE